MAPARLCSVAGCGRPHDAKGFCNIHYMRARRGTSLDQPVSPKSFTTKPGEPLRFVQEVALTYTGDDCLIWPFGRGTGGYPLIVIGTDKRKVASRYVCELAHGAPPSELHEAALTCHNGHNGCVNPRHLVWRTQDENIATRVAEGRSAKGPQMPHAKLDENKVRAIRRAYAYASAADLAEAYGVAETTIYNVIRRKKWAWVPD